MDVETRTTYLRLFVNRWLRFLTAAALLVAPVALSTVALAIDEKAPLHYNGDKYIWDRKNNIVTMIGHATVNQPGETIIADYIQLNLQDRTVVARGNVKYFMPDMVVESEEMEFDLTSRTGSILKGRMSGQGFSLTGDRINKLSGSRYQTLNGSYTTCKDCPQSWIMEGESVDLTFGGYAVIKNMRFRVLDTPILWSPLMVFPLKTQRQSGVLFPSQGLWNGNFYFTIPFFWAISRWADMTITAGYYFGDYGPRLAWEGRYALTPRSGGTANFFYLMDRTAISPAMNRWAVRVEARQELPWGFDSRIRINEMHDHLYPNWIGDVPGRAEPVANSDLSVWGSNNYLSGYVMARRSRNMLNFDHPTEFDNSTVQLLPRAELSTKDRRLFGLPIATGVSFGLSNFTRAAPMFDLSPDLRAWFEEKKTNAAAPLVAPELGSRAFVPGQDPIRTGTRLLMQPSVYVAFQPWGLFSVVPALEYRFFYYNFRDTVPDLTRGYFQFRTDFTTQLERVYETSSVEYPRVKHLIRPTLTYFLIPYEHRSDENHPFIQQIEYAQSYGITGYNFDSHDIVPIDPPQNYNSYFFPVGNALAYGVTTQLIRRKGAMGTAGVYERLLELYGRQSVNFIKLGNSFNVSPFSVLQTGASFSLGRFGSSLSVNYYPDTAPGNVPWTIGFSTGFSFAPPLGRGLFAFERSLGFSFQYQKLSGATVPPQSLVSLTSVFSISDYIMPRGAITYDFATLILQRVNAGVRFQSPSECWYLELGVNHERCTAEGNYCTSYTTDFKMNFTGSGFSGVGEFAERLQTSATTGSGL